MRWILRVFLGLVALALIGALVLVMLPSERIAGVLTDRFEQATGRRMTISGDISPSLWPSLGARIGQVTIDNAKWTDGQPMVTAESISVGVDLAALLGGQIKLREVTIQSPRIRLERARNGQVNWDFSQGAQSGGAGAGATGALGVPAFSLDKAAIRDAQISYFDRAAGSALVLTKTDIDLSLPDFNGPMKMTIKGLLNGEPLDTTVQIESLAALLAGKGRVVGGNIAIGASSASFDGTVGLRPVGADMVIDATLNDLAQLFRAIGQAPPKLPKGMGERISIKGKVSFADGDKIFLRDGVLNLDGNALSGKADVVIGAKPRVTGAFSGGALNFSRLLAGGAADNRGWSGWPKERIDVSGLGAIDADITLAARSIDLGALRLDRASLRLTLDNRRAVFRLGDVRAYGGRATGQFVLNGRGGLSVGSNLTLSAVQIQPLLKDLTGYERLLGQASLTLDLQSSGNSIDGIMKGLGGTASFEVGKGELKGLDIVGMIRNLDPSYVGEGQKTIFDQITATARIDKGVLSNKDLFFSAPLMTAAGRGTVDVGQQTLNYTLTPATLQGTDGTGGVKVPLNISGTWANPKFGLDLKALADQNLEKEQAALKARLEAERAAAEARLKAQAEKALGTTAKPGESAQDVLRRKLEGEVKKGLFDLLGGGSGSSGAGAGSGGN